MNGEGRKILGYFEKRFGIGPEHFDEHELYLGSKGRIFLGPRITAVSAMVSVGILIARSHGSVKPSTNMIQLFGKHASKNVIRLSKKRAISYVKGEDLRLTPDEKADATDGYVIVQYSAFALGCGLLKDSVMKNMIPKAKRAELKFL